VFKWKNVTVKEGGLGNVQISLTSPKLNKSLKFYLEDICDDYEWEEVDRQTWTYVLKNYNSDKFKALIKKLEVKKQYLFVVMAHRKPKQGMHIQQVTAQAPLPIVISNAVKELACMPCPLHLLLVERQEIDSFQAAWRTVEQ
jgi:hypothetical protein